MLLLQIYKDIIAHLDTFSLRRGQCGYENNTAHSILQRSEEALQLLEDHPAHSHLSEMAAASWRADELEK